MFYELSVLANKVSLSEPPNVTDLELLPKERSLHGLGGGGMTGPWPPLCAVSGAGVTASGRKGAIPLGNTTTNSC